MSLLTSGRARLNSAAASLSAREESLVNDSIFDQEPRSDQEGSSPQLQADSCLGYGLYWLENDEQGGFRWSRRFFGFYLDLDHIRELQIDFDSTLETSLTFFSDRTEIASIKILPGRQTATFRVPPGSRKYRVWHAGFTVADTWRPDGDVRTLGIKWLGLRVSTDAGTVCYGADTYSHNGTKTDWLRLDDYFRLQGNTMRDLRRNASLNVKERKTETAHVLSTPLRL
jgi:hypothetical protein